uniref:Dynein light chain Tctex-type 3 n=1 Tax=Equus asinus asinus TaxID=83772 RepID=A0A8C4PSA2_EQUAS
PQYWALTHTVESRLTDTTSPNLIHAGTIPSSLTPIPSFQKGRRQRGVAFHRLERCRRPLEGGASTTQRRGPRGRTPRDIDGAGPPRRPVRGRGARLARRSALGRVGATMEEYHRHCDEVGFNADEAHNIIKECIDGVLGGEDYNQNNINQWTASIVEQSLAHLVKLGKAYKYIVTCAVVQRSAYGFHTASSCFWDTTSDGKRP